MVRYTQRKWYTPIGFMSQNLPSYPAMLIVVSCLFAYPFRYSVADYWERCAQDPGDILKAKAIVYYTEMEIVAQRNAYVFSRRMENGLFENTEVRMVGESLKKGDLSIDEEYFRVHYADTLRVKAMMDEVESLKAALANDRKTLAAA